MPERTMVALELTDRELRRLAEDALQDIIVVTYHDHPDLEDGRVENWTVAELEELKAEVGSTIDRAIELLRVIEGGLEVDDA